jgi:heat shock protein HslJ
MAVSRWSAVVVLLTLLAACAEPSSPAGDPTGVVWELQSGRIDEGPVPIVEGHPITLSLTDEGAGGTSACNSYSGEYVVSDDRISFSDLTHTEMGCVPAEIMESERVYLEGLARVDRFSTGEGDLNLSGEGVELVFVPLPPVPDAGLTATVWVLDGLVQGDSMSSVAGDRATLEMFSDGSLLGSTGCRSLNGSYVVTGTGVSVSGLEAEGNCPSELTDQDALVVTVLSDGFTAEVQGNTLTLSTTGGLGLVYLAAD